MRLVVGLGNPGTEYSGTRHNLGFMAVEEFCRQSGWCWSRPACDARTARGRLGALEVLVAQPQTFMNASGEAVACLMRSVGVLPADLLVVCDDVAIDFGTLRVRPGGGDAGHRGLRSIARAIGSQDFPRLRLGIRTPHAGEEDLAAHVLGDFTEAQRQALGEQIGKAAECMRVILQEGISVAMNRFNRRQTRDPLDPGLAR